MMLISLSVKNRFWWSLLPLICRDDEDHDARERGKPANSRAVTKFIHETVAAANKRGEKEKRDFLWIFSVGPTLSKHVVLLAVAQIFAYIQHRQHTTRRAHST